MNRKRILLIIAWLLAFAVVAETMTVWLFWRSPWTPIERHYLPAYIWCSLPVVSSTVEVQWVWKTGRHRKRQLATDDDAIDSGSGMALSPSALNAGWKSLLEDPRQPVPSDELRPYLAGLAFEDQSLWELLLFPELTALAVLLVSLVAWFLLIGTLRALIAEYAWRRRLSFRHELLPALSKDCTALTSQVCSYLEVVYRSALRRTAMHVAATNANIAQPRQPATPASFAFPVFGVYSRTGRSYLWSDKDEID